MALERTGKIPGDLRGRMRLVAAAMVAAAAVIVFLNTLPYAYIYDDINEIRSNTRVHHLGSIPALLTTEFLLGTRGKGFLYRPVTAATIPPLFVAGQGSPAVFHAANILLHAFIAAMLGAILARLAGDRRLGLAAGLLFAVLPIHTEAVAWISGRSELLQAAAGLAAWAFHLRAREGSRPWSAAAALAFFAFALGSKESAVAWPLVFAAADRIPQGQDARRPRPKPSLYAGYAGVFAAWVLLRFAVLGQLGRLPWQGAAYLNPLEGRPWWPFRPLTALRLVFTGASKTLVPGGACIDYGFDQIPLASSVFHADVAAGAAILAGAVFLIGRGLAGRNRGRAAALAGLAAVIFVLFWFPVSSLLLPSVSIFSERNMYMPSAGIVLALVVAARYAARRIGRPRLAAAAGIVILAALAAQTFARNRAYEDGLALYASSTRACPRSARARFLYGTALQEAGRIGEAAGAYRSALGVAPDYVDARAALAEALGMQGKHEEAAGEALAARAEGARDIGTRLSVAWALAGTGSARAADAEMASLMREAPDDPRVLFFRAQLLAAAGRNDEALAVYTALDDRFPDNPAGMNGTATIHMVRGEDAEARRAVNRALEKDPFDTSALFNKGLLVLREGGGTAAAREAEDLFGRFLTIRPRDALGWIHLGEVRARLGRMGEAETALLQAVALAPGHPRPREALEQFREHGKVEGEMSARPATERPPS